MTQVRTLFLPTLVFGIALAAASAGHASGPPAHQHGDGHAHAPAHAQVADVPVPADHTPWTPDAPLVEGMARVRAAVAALAAGAGEAAVAASAADVDAAVEYMFANCRLPAEPDVALHAILARLMAATQALRVDPGDATAVADMRAAIANYEALFADPGA